MKGLKPFFCVYSFYFIYKNVNIDLGDNHG